MPKRITEVRVTETDCTPQVSLISAVITVFPAFKETIKEKMQCFDTVITHLPGDLLRVSAVFYDPLSEDSEQIEISSFRLSKMPGCSAIMVSSRERVGIPWRNRGLGRVFQELRNAIAKEMRCSVIQCTTVATNIRQNTLMNHNGWQTIDQFLNPVTGNNVIIWTRRV